MQNKLPVLTNATLEALFEATGDRDLVALQLNAPKVESWAEIMKRENPLLFSRLERFAQVQPLHVRPRILYTGTMIYMALSAQLAADNTEL